MDLLLRLHGQALQVALKVLLAGVGIALFLIARLVLPLIRSAVVALVRFPAVVADRHYELQRAEVEVMLAEPRRSPRPHAPAPVAELAPLARPMSDSEPASATGPESDSDLAGAAEPSAGPTTTPAPDPDSRSEPAPEPTPEPDPEDSAEVDEGPVLRYRPKPASGD